MRALALFWIAYAALGQSPAEIAERAGKAMQQQDYAAAEVAYRQFVKLSPEVAEAYSNLGLACYFQKKFAGAEEAFAKALHLSPDLFLPNFLLSQIRFQQGRYQESLPMIRKARAAQPRQREVLQLYAATLVGLKRYQEAAAEYQAALQADSRDQDSYYGLGSVYLQLGRNVIERLAGEEAFASLLTAQHYAPIEQWQAAALTAYQAAIAKAPSMPGVRVAYARLLMAAKNRATARQTLEDELHLDPHSYEARFELARVALAQGDLEQGRRWLEEAAGIRPEYFDPFPELGVELKPDTLADLRSRIAGAARTARAAMAPSPKPGGPAAEKLAYDLLKRKRYEQGLEILLPLARTRRLEPRTEVEMARSLFATGRFDDLIAVFAQPDRGVPEITLLLGSAYKESALQMLTKMVQLAPDSVRSHQVLGDAFFAEDRFAEALGEYQAAAKIQPRDPELHFLVGNSYFKQMQFPLAVESFERTIQLDPLNVEAYLMKGEALMLLGETGAAVPALQKSLELDKNLARAHLLLGKAYSGQGKLDEALLHLEKGAVADKDGSAHYQLFLLYRRLQQPEKAQQALRRSQELRQSAPKTPLVSVQP